MTLENEAIKMEADLLYKEKDLLITYALWFVLGVFGLHRFYLGKTKSAVIMLVLTLFGWLTAAILIGIIPLLIVCVWWFIDAFKTYKFVEEYNADMKTKKIAFLSQKATTENKVVVNS
jgi:TM2 domain-containing membrane protein YozV